MKSVSGLTKTLLWLLLVIPVLSHCAANEESLSQESPGREMPDRKVPSHDLPSRDSNSKDSNDQQPGRSKSQGHAHNDYLHERPLLEAVEQGFVSIEADVFPIENDLLVAHTFLELSRDRTLEKLYLKPLEELVRKNSGSVHGDGQSVILLVDIKREGKKALEILNRQLAPYAAILSESSGDVFTERAVTVVISGDRPVEEIRRLQPRRVSIDGRLSDLESDASSSLVPLISDHWGSHFRYRGNGPMSETEREKLRQIVQKTHARGRRIRFWATPESPEVWKELRDADVDLIGTDDLPKLRQFLDTQP